VEQELLTLPAHLSLPPALSGVRVAQSLVLEQTTQCPKEKGQRDNNDLQNIHIKLKIE
jgi:hypothetical protein